MFTQKVMKMSSNLTKSVPKRKRNSIKLETKYKIIKLLNEKKSYSEIIERFGDEIKDSSNISKIKKNRESIIREYETLTSTQVKKLRKSKYPDIEKALIEFISNCNNNGLYINTLLLKEKANEIALNLNYIDFNCSNGFLDRFKSRNAVIFETFHGESEGVSEKMTNDWINTKLPN